MIGRYLVQNIKNKLFKGKAIILFGPRQVGKTTLINDLLKNTDYKILFLDGDDPYIQDILNRPNTEQLKQLLGKNNIVFIDEAQRINEIGLTSKIIVDQIKDEQLILSGSSSFDLANTTQEPLTGRKWTFNLWPISWGEWEEHIGYLKAQQDLESRLVYGMYPDVLNHLDEQQNILKELSDSYLYKDILSFANLNKPELVHKIVKALAFQVGSEVSYNEVAQLVGADPKTVTHYIDILEKAFILFRLPTFSRNLRDEIKTNRKIYFYDNGIRNAAINQFQPVGMRQDIGALWENFLMSERQKVLAYNNISAEKYFWRTKQMQEIDYIEEKDGKITAFEFKWNPKRNIQFSKTFTENYACTTLGVTKENFREFLKIS